MSAAVLTLTVNSLTTNNKMPLAWLVSTIIYLAILFGISFDATSPPTNKPITTLDVILVTEKTDEIPEEADFLAQENNDGGSNNNKDKPAQPSSVPKVKQSVVKPIPREIVEPSSPKPLNALTQDIAERKIEATEESKKQAKRRTRITPKPVLSAKELMAKTRQQVALLDKKRDAVSKDASSAPKKLILSSRTKQYAAAAYKTAWNKKNENIGNLNYPIEAKRLDIYGSLILSVDISPDGSVPPDGIVIVRSSGHKVLDEAAVNIVRLAAPYAAIPKEVLQDNDMITITRKWNFKKEGILSSTN